LQNLAEGIGAFADFAILDQYAGAGSRKNRYPNIHALIGVLIFKIALLQSVAAQA
jgi:hypothetical protein